MSVKYPNYVNLTSLSEEQPNERTPSPPPRKKSLSSPQDPSLAKVHTTPLHHHQPPGPSNPSSPPRVSRPPPGFPNPPPGFEPLPSTQPLSYVIWERVHDFQLGIESYQMKINLTAPTITFRSIEKVPLYSIIGIPFVGIVYENSKKEKRATDIEEL
nr:hypothetical protein [Tanacetum cinerariifolium]